MRYLLVLFLVGCSSQPLSYHERAANMAYLECRDYYHDRQIQTGVILVFPDPRDICLMVRDRVRHGRPVPEWRF